MAADTTPYTEMWRFMVHINQKHRGSSLCKYKSIHQWSVANPEKFWAEVWEYVGITCEKRFTRAIPHTNSSTIIRPNYFKDAYLNYAKNILFPAKVCVNPSSPALIAVSSPTSKSLDKVYTWSSLRTAVARTSTALRKYGISPGDVVIASMANRAESVIAMLACATVGAVWCIVNPGLPTDEVVECFERFDAKMLFIDNGAVLQGNLTDLTPDIITIAGRLKACNLKHVIVNPVIRDPHLKAVNALNSEGVKAFYWDSFGKDIPSPTLEFKSVPPSHPLCITFTARTFDKPSVALMHSVAGVLVQHKKEHIIHGNVSRESRVFCYTKPSWMMWYWNISALACGASIVVYTVVPTDRPDVILSISSRLAVTHLVAPSTYLSSLQKSRTRVSRFSLSSLQVFYSPDCPLPASTFTWFYSYFPQTVMLANITPNNDAMCLLTAPYTLESLKPGFTQPPALGMHFKSVNTFRSTAPSGYTIGELAIAEPFPTQPVGVYETEGVTGSSGYHAYYRTNWHHEMAKNIRPFVGFWHMPDWFVEKDTDGDVVWVGPVEVLFKESRYQREAGLALVKKIKNTMISRVRNAMVLTHPLQNEAPKTYLFVDLIDGVSMSSHLTTALEDLIKSMEHPPHITHIVEADSGIPTDFQGNPVPILVQKILAGLGVAPGQDIVNPETLGWFRMWINNNQHNGRPMLRQDDVSLPQAGFERPYTGESTITEAHSTAERDILGKPG